MNLVKSDKEIPEKTRPIRLIKLQTTDYNYDSVPKSHSINITENICKHSSRYKLLQTVYVKVSSIC